MSNDTVNGSTATEKPEETTTETNTTPAPESPEGGTAGAEQPSN